MKRSTSLWAPLLFLALLTPGCSDSGESDTDVHQGEEAHDHGPGTHEHDEEGTASDAGTAAGTTVDTTGGFFDDSVNHDHHTTNETHEHDGGEHSH